jgi:hypothetical protein
MLVIIALYQEWTPFLLAIGYVAIHHGLVGTLAPTSVYNHPAAWAHPWQWATIHAVFVLAASIATIVNWRLIEAAYARAEDQQARARRLHTLTRLNQLISASLDMDHLLREIAQAAATLMHAPLVGFFIADEATHTWRFGRSRTRQSPPISPWGNYASARGPWGGWRGIGAPSTSPTSSPTAGTRPATGCTPMICTVFSGCRSYWRIGSLRCSRSTAGSPSLLALRSRCS